MVATAVTPIMSRSSAGCSGSCWCWRSRRWPLSGMFAMIVGYTLPDVPGLRWVSPVLGTVIYVWGGRPFLTGAVSEIRSRAPGMMLLIGLAITVAFVSSMGQQPRACWATSSTSGGNWSLLIVIMLLGHWIEMRSLAQTSSALDSLAALLPDEAERVVGRQVVRVPPSELRVGDVVIVRPGGSVPGRRRDRRRRRRDERVDGHRRVRAGAPRRRATTSSPAPSRPTPGCASGSPPSATTPRSPASSGWSPRRRTRRRARSGSPTSRPAGCSGSRSGRRIITAVVWGFLGQPDEAVIRTITVLVIACPHALGLAIPLVVSIATERAARGGVLVKDRLALESMRTVGAVLFDKTGTLTKGEPAVTAIAARSRGARTRCSRWRRPPNPTPSIRWPARSSSRAAERGLSVPRVDGLLVVAGGRRDRDGRRADRPGGRSAPAGGGRTGRAGRDGGLARRGCDRAARARRRRRWSAR